MSIEQMREALKRTYPGENWEKKVDKMSEAQVHSIYTRLLSSGKIK